MNALYIRRQSKLLLPESTGQTPITVIATLHKNIETLGYRLSSEVFEQLQRLAPEQVAAFYQRLVKDLIVLVGAHRKFDPLYPNFPQQVMQASAVELYVNALIHYWTMQRPGYPKEERPELNEPTPYRLIHLGNRADFEAIFARLAASKSPYSVQDREDVQWFINQYQGRIYSLLPPTIPSRENLAVLGAGLLRHTNLDQARAFLDSQIKTATDVLRLAVALSGGDVSLATPSKFGKFRRSERALLLHYVEKAANRVEDMLRWKPRWIRLGEHLHPGDYAQRFPQTLEAFDILRNNRPYQTFNAQIEQGLIARDTPRVVSLLQSRPSEMARRLDHLCRISPDPQGVIESFTQRVSGVSTPVLLQVLTHFRRRHQQGNLRVFFPKGEIAKLFATPQGLPKLSQKLSQQIVDICERALLERFSQLPPLGKTYIDPNLKDYLVPFSQRSASKALRTLVRGSRLPLPEGSTLRFFCWWMNGRGRVDIDLSAAMYDTNYGYIDTLAYYNLKNFGAHHSGDIVDAPKGAAEFIDIDIQRCKEQGVRYVVMNLNSYTRQPYCDLPECFAGWMSRQEPGSGEVFEPRTVVDKVDIASNTSLCLPAAFDLKRNQVIWLDIALSHNPRFANNVHNNLSGVSLMLRAMTQLRKTDLFTLFELHAKARGEIIESRALAQTVFAVDDGITPFDLDRITAEFM